MRPIEEQLLLHDGLRLRPYRDTKGVLTIGVGRNLEAKGISREEALSLLQNDIREVTGHLQQYEWYSKLDPIRQKVIIDMCFNLGLNGLLRFRNMIAAIEAGDYQAAADHMVNSAWYKQVGSRSRRLERMMRTGEDYTD
jgi:lysozyme